MALQPVRDEKLLRDQSLMERVASGNPKAQEELVTMLWRRVNNMARHFSPDPTEAEDLSQEVMLQILRFAKSFRADGCVEAWADTIAVRTIMKRIRRLRAKWSFVHLDWIGSADPATATENQVLQRERSENIAVLLSKLKENQRMVLLLKLGYGYTIDEVASLTGKSSVRVRQLLRKGRTVLRKQAAKDPRWVELLKRGDA